MYIDVGVVHPQSGGDDDDCESAQLLKRDGETKIYAYSLAMINTSDLTRNRLLLWAVDE